MGKFIDLTGKKFGRWTVIGLKKEDKFYRRMWYCVCECGNKSIVDGLNLRHGYSKSCGCFKKRLPPGEAAFNVLFYRYKHRKCSKKRIFNISKKSFRLLTSRHCHYCGEPPKQKISGATLYSVYLYNGLDRIDSSKGYYIKNVVPCCFKCNKMKSILPSTDFLNHINKIYLHQRKENDNNN